MRKWRTVWLRPTGSARRREWRTFDGLHAALAGALDCITDLDDRVEPVTPTERRVARAGAVTTATAPEGTPDPAP
jgi:hypothetical protein